MADSKRQLALWISSILNLCLFMMFPGIKGDVPDDVVYTELHKDVRIGDRAVLTCRFRGSPLAVYWKKGYDPRRSPNLVSWIPTDDDTGKCESQRVCEIMQMNGNYSLIIKDVGISEQGRYICRVSNYKGNIIHNFTDISLYAPPEEPYPVIDLCLNNGSSVGNSDPCRVLTNNNITITCSVTNYYPYIELFFLHGTTQMATIHQEEQTNVDSTKNMSISIEAGPSETLYTCVASDVPGSKERKAASILVESFFSIPSERIPVTVETMREGCPVTITAIIASSIVLLGAAVVFVWWKWKRRHTNNGGIQELENDEPESNLMLDGVEQSATSLETKQTSSQRREGTLGINPARERDFDDIMKTIAKMVVSRSEIHDVGSALGFGPADIECYVEDNKNRAGVSYIMYMGTLSMLRMWRKKQTKNTELKALQTALEEAGQIHLADEIFGE